jgi:hypothetical protein
VDGLGKKGILYLRVDEIVSTVSPPRWLNSLKVQMPIWWIICSFFA